MKKSRGLDKIFPVSDKLKCWKIYREDLSALSEWRNCSED